MKPELTDNQQLEINRLNTFEAIEKLQPAWNALHQNCTRKSIYNSFDFIYQSVKTFLDDPNKLCILTVTDAASKELVGIFPLQFWKERAAFITLSSLDYAATEEIDKPYPIFREGYARQAWRVLFQYLKQTDWDHIRLIEMPNDLEEIVFFEELSRELGLIYHIHPDDPGPMISLDGNWETYWSQHRKMRKKIRKIEKDFSGRLEFKVHTDNWEWCLDEYIALEAKSWKKKKKVGISKNKKNIEFYRRFCQTLAENDNLFFGFLTIDGEVVSAEIAYTLDHMAYFCHGCFDKAYQKYSPGMASTCYFIKHFYESDITQGDYLCGFAGYLNQWSDSIVETKSLDLYRNSVKVRTLMNGRKIKEMFWNRSVYALKKFCGRLRDEYKKIKTSFS